MPLTPEAARWYAQKQGFNPDDVDVNLDTAEITPKVKVSPAISPTHQPPGAVSTALRSASLNALPSAVALPVGAAAGAATGAALTPVMGPYAAIPALGAGLVAGGLASIPVRGVQDFVISKVPGGEKYLQTTAEAAEAHPIAAAVGDVASTLPLMGVSPRMLKNAVAPIVSEASTGGANVAKRVLQNEAAKNVLMNAGIGAGSSVIGDIQEDRPVDLTKAAVVGGLQGIVSQPHRWSAKVGLHPYVGEAGDLNPAAMIAKRGAGKVNLIDPAKQAAYDEASAKIATKQQELAAKQTELKARMAEHQDAALLEVQKLGAAELQKQIDETQAQLDALKEKASTQYTPLSASDEMKAYVEQQAAAKGVTEPVEWQDTGHKPEDGKFGSFSSDGRKITASTDAGLVDAKGKAGPSYNRDAAGKGVASTGVHETMHAQWYNLENTPEYQENGLAAGMKKAVENSEGYKNRVDSGEFGTSDKDKAFAAAMSPEEYAVIHGTRKFFADPLNEGRQLFEERNAVRRIKRGEGSLEDALRVQDMMYRYDRNQGAERGAAGGATKNSLRSDTDAAIKAELERPKVPVQAEFNLQPHNELSRWKEANFPEPSLKEQEAKRQAAEKAKIDRAEFKKWLQSQSKFSAAADEPVGVDNLMHDALDNSKREKFQQDFFTRYPALSGKPLRLWNNEKLAEWFGVSRQKITNARSRGVNFDTYQPNAYSVRNEEGKLEPRDRPQNDTLNDDAFSTPEAYAELQKAVSNALFPVKVGGHGARGEKTLKTAYNIDGVKTDYVPTYINNMVNRVRERLASEGLRPAEGEEVRRNVYRNASRIAQKLMHEDVQQIIARQDFEREQTSKKAGVMMPEKAAAPKTNVVDFKQFGELENLAKHWLHTEGPSAPETANALRNLNEAYTKAGLSKTQIGDRVKNIMLGEQRDIISQDESGMRERHIYDDSGLEDKYSEAADEPVVFSTSFEKELEKPRPFNLQVGKDGKLTSIDLIHAIKKLPPIEQDLLNTAGIKDKLSVQSRISADDLKRWVQENGPKVEVKSYGAEGKVSEAAKELGRMQHEWWDNLADAHKKDIVAWYNKEKPVMSVSEADQQKAVRFFELRKIAGNESNDTTPKMTDLQVGAYEHVSPKSTEEPMPEWTTSAREANGIKVYHKGRYSPTGENPPLASGYWTPIHVGNEKTLKNVIGYGDVKEYYLNGKNKRVTDDEANDIAYMRKLAEEGYKYVTYKNEHEMGGDSYAVLDHTALSKTQNNAPKNVQRVDVVIPQPKVTPEQVAAKMRADGYSEKEIQRDMYNTAQAIAEGRITVPSTGKNGDPAWNVKWQPDNLHEQHPNTLGWAAIQYETGPNGEKIAHIFEVQSRWGQTVRNARTNPEEATGYERTAKDHPLLRDYNRLILKAAIEQARKEGATHIVVSDKHTALMSEHLDEQAHHTERTFKTEKEAENELDKIQEIPSASGDYESARVEQDGDKWKVIVPKSAWKAYGGEPHLRSLGYELEREPGFRHNYDTDMPQIMRELTGSKGEKVSLGEHKNAFETRGAYPDEGGVGSITTDIPRQNLIFRNPDGTPKTDVSGMMYDISAPAARRALGEKFSLAERRFSEAADEPIDPNRFDKTKQGFIEALAPQVDQVRKYDSRVADALAKTLFDKQVLSGKFVHAVDRDMKAEFPTATKTDRELAQDYLQDMWDIETGIAPKNSVDTSRYTDMQQKMAQALMDKLYTPTRELQREKRMLVEEADGTRRLPRQSEFYAPNMLSRKAIDLFTRGDNPETVEAAKRDWANHIVERSKDSHNPIKFDDAYEGVTGYVDALGKTGAHSADFGALRKAAGFGIPSSLRERDAYEVARRYGIRYARDFAKFDNLERDSYVRSKLALEDPETGRVSSAPDNGRLTSHEEVKDAMKFVNDSFENQRSPKMLSLARVVSNSLLALPTGVRDFVSIPANTIPYLRNAADYADVVKSFVDMRKEWRNSLDVGARTGAHPLNSIDAPQGDDKIVNAFNTAAEMLRKYSGRDALEQVNRAWTFAIGKNLAERAVKTDNKKFLERFGKFGKREDGTYDTNLLAKAFTDRVQGSYDGRGLSASVVDGMASPWFQMSRWSLEKSNIIWQDIVKPAYKQNDYIPLLTYTLGTMVTGTVIEQLNEIMAGGKKSQNANWTELAAADKQGLLDKKQYALRLANIAQLGSFMGIIGDAAKVGADTLTGEVPHGVTVPTVDFLTQGIWQNVENFSRAVSDGADPIDAIETLALNFAKTQSQMGRMINNFAKPEDVDRSNKMRDLRVFNKITGMELPPADHVVNNPAFRENETRFKKESDPEKIGDEVSGLMTELTKIGESDPVKMMKAFERVKRMSYNTMPSMDHDMYQAARYWQYMVDAYGQDEATKRFEDNMKQTMLNKVKASLIPKIS